jgi:hypothetical protein
MRLIDRSEREGRGMVEEDSQDSRERELVLDQPKAKMA